MVYLRGYYEDDAAVKAFYQSAELFYSNGISYGLHDRVIFHTDIRTIVAGEKVDGVMKYTDHFVYEINEGKDGYKKGVMGRQGKLDYSGEGRLIFKLTETDLAKITDRLVVVGVDDQGNTINITLDCAYTFFYEGENKIEAANNDCAAFAIVDANDVDISEFTAYGYYRVKSNLSSLIPKM